MTTKYPTKYPVLTRQQTAELQAELDAIRDEVMADVGDTDARHIRRMVRIARLSAITGRGLLMFGFTPISWTLGVAALSTAKILENMEIGHNVMHGQYDWMNDPALDSQTYDWDNVCAGEDWRHSHNVMHHNYTNIVGKDVDVGYGILRVTDAQRWHPKYLLNPVNNLALALLFQWGVGIHELQMGTNLRTRKGRQSIRANSGPFLKKMRKQLVKDYVLFPALALWNAPRVLLGNLAANGVRNLWSYAIIFCGHFPDGTRMYTEAETLNETRGEWYLRQMQGSANIEGGRLMHIMSGHLSHQIEHHLFPDMPAPRYAQISPKVRAVCEKYGLPYNSGSFVRQYGSVLRTIFKRALPESGRTPKAVAASV